MFFLPQSPLVLQVVVLVVYHDADELENVTVTNVSTALFKHVFFLIFFFFLAQLPKKIRLM